MTAIPEDLSIPAFLRRELTPEAKASIAKTVEQMKNQFRQPRRLRRRHLTDEQATERRIKDEADRRWRSWIPTKEEHHRPRLATFERRVRKEFKAKVAHKMEDVMAKTKAGKKEAALRKARAPKAKPRTKDALAEILADPPQPVVSDVTDISMAELNMAPGAFDRIAAEVGELKPAKQKPERAPVGTPGGVRPGSKLEAIVKLLTRKEGCTTADVLKATGWPSVSMPQQAKAAGLTLRKEKAGGVTRYRAA